MPHTIALILAGGSGRRFGGRRPKQFIRVAGHTVLEHSVAAFARSAAVDEIGIVAHPDYLEEIRTLIYESRLPKVTRIVAGGKERQDSTLNGLRAFVNDDGSLKSAASARETCDFSVEKSNLSAEKSDFFSANSDVRILIHDAVRAGVSEALIARVCAALDTHPAANPVLPVTDTLITVDADGHTLAVPERACLRRVQTPQGFRAPLLLEAYRRALSDPNFRATDDCGVVFRYCPEADIALVEGEQRNLKLTYPEDLIVLTHHLTHTAP